MQAKCSHSGAAAMERVKGSVNRKNPSPCKDCNKRAPGCHSKCALYSDWKTRISELKKEILKSYAKANSGTLEAKKRKARYVQPDILWLRSVTHMRYFSEDLFVKEDTNDQN